ncbi:MAG: hypothetical protein JNM45_17095 [Rhizobiales bacterium]|nr:hypothetical protein [Hyphomicrobiales bacterium]
MNAVNDMNQPQTSKDVQKSARKARLARALKANIKRRKTPPDPPAGGERDRKDERED